MRGPYRIAAAWAPKRMREGGRVRRRSFGSALPLPSPERHQPTQLGTFPSRTSETHQTLNEAQHVDEA
jgi:hypothetical protein